jgi:hypothetical protein
MTRRRSVKGAVAAHPLLAKIPRRLKLQAQWVEHTPDGTAFIVTETGCWLSVGDSVLHVEIRVAVDVWDGARAAEFCDQRNHYALLGRWVYDAASSVVALVADIPLPDQPTFDLPAVATEIVAELINAAATVQFMSAPQRDLDGYKAVPALRGKIRSTRNRTDEHLPNYTYPRGSDPAVAEETLILTQDILLIPLLGWDVEHEAGRTLAEHRDGSVLLIQVAQHPHAGWGLVVSLQPPWTAHVDAMNALNASAGSAGLTYWTANGSAVENRLFLPNAALESCRGDTWGAAEFVVSIVETVSNQRGSTPQGGPALLRPTWPGDDVTTAYRRRRDLWNDGREDDAPEWYAIFLDVFGRMCTLTEPSYRRWHARLKADDLADAGTAGFINFMQERMLDREERLREHGEHRPQQGR